MRRSDVQRAASGATKPVSSSRRLTQIEPRHGRRSARRSCGEDRPDASSIQWASSMTTSVGARDHAGQVLDGHLLELGSCGTPRRGRSTSRRRRDLDVGEDRQQREPRQQIRGAPCERRSPSRCAIDARSSAGRPARAGARRRSAERQVGDRRTRTARSWSRAGAGRAPRPGTRLSSRVLPIPGSPTSSIDRPRAIRGRSSSAPAERVHLARRGRRAGDRARPPRPCCPWSGPTMNAWTGSLLALHHERLERQRVERDRGRVEHRPGREDLARRSPSTITRAARFTASPITV